MRPVSSIFGSTAPCLPLPTSSNRTDASSSSNRLPSVSKVYERTSSVILYSRSNVVSRVHTEEKLTAVIDEGLGLVLLCIQLAQLVHALGRGRFQLHQLSVHLEESVAILVNGLGAR